MTPQEARGFHGHWFFYAAERGVLAALYRARDADRVPGT